jgi:hypothetical protein
MPTSNYRYISLVPAILAAGVIMYISWQHNPQCEIHCEGKINWGYWLLLGFSGFVSTWLISHALVVGIRFVKPNT